MNDLKKEIKLAKKGIYSNYYDNDDKIFRDISNLERLIKKENDESMKSKAYTIIGDLYRIANNNEKAFGYYKLAITADSKNTKVYASMIYSYLENNEFKEALNITRILINSNFLDKNGLKNALQLEKILLFIINNEYDKELKYSENNEILNSCIALSIDKYCINKRKKSVENVKNSFNDITTKSYKKTVNDAVSLYNQRLIKDTDVEELVIKLIELKRYAVAEELIKLIKSNSSRNKHVKYYERRIEEEVFYSKQKNKEKELVEYLVKIGKSCYKDKKYDASLYYNELGKKMTNDYVFDYYLGKTYYRMHNYKKATEHLNSYSKQGFEKLSKCYYFLFLSQVKSKGSYGRTYQNNKELCEAYRINNNFSRHFNDLYIRVEVSKEKTFDKNKSLAYKYVDMTEEDFKKTKRK